MTTDAQEFVDVVDADDRVISTLARDELSRSGAGYRVVHVLVLDGKGNLLLQRPAPALGKAFVLGSSVAGHVRAGESYDAAAAREFEEELGIPPVGLKSIGKTWVDAGHARKFVGVYVTTDDRKFSPDPGEVLGLDRVSVGDVRRMLRETPCPFSETFARAFRHADAQGHFV